MSLLEGGGRGGEDPFNAKKFPEKKVQDPLQTYYQNIAKRKFLTFVKERQKKGQKKKKLRALHLYLHPTLQLKQ